MRIAIIVAGYIRSFNSNIESWKKYLIKDNTYDIYLHITENENCEDKYFNKYDIETIKNELNIKNIIVSKNIYYDNDKKINSIFNQFYKYYLLNNLKNDVMEIENIHYDIVIKLRPDVLLLNDINLPDNSKYLYIPIDSKIDKSKLKYSNDNHICDIIAYGNNNVMNYYFKFLKNLKDLIEKYGTIQETLMYNYLNNNNIEYELVNINFNVILSLYNVINICGDSSSGKTTLSEYIKKDMKNAFILECDRYHKWERGNINWNNYTHLNPDANYLTKMQEDVFDLKVGKNIYQIDYDHSTGKFTDKKIIESKENIVVCGLHTNYLTNSNLSIFMDTDENLRIPWKINRDMKKRGYSSEKIIEQISSRKKDYIKYIYPQILTSNIIINLYTKNPYKKENDINNLDVCLSIYIENKFNILDFLKYINNLNYKYTLEDFKNSIDIQYNVIKFEYLEIDYYELILVLIKMLKNK